MARGNTVSVETTANAIMRTPAFASGVEDAMLGLRLDEKSWRGNWEYEYGRLWQVATRMGPVIQVRGKVLQEQQDAFNRIYGRDIPLVIQHLPSADELGL